MRKLLSILLVLALLLGLCACAQQDGPGKNATNAPVQDSGLAQSDTPQPTSAVISQKGKQLGAGSIVRFGAYEQDNDLENGKEPIDWLVLDVQDGTALLISYDILDVQPFNASDTSYNKWDESLIRQWLNSDFYNTAFSTEEQPFVLLSDLVTPPNTYYETIACNDTQDYVFLLSSSEIDQYFQGAWDSIGNLDYIAEMCAKPSAYALAKGLEANETGHARWFLRSPSHVRLIPISSVTASGFVASPGVHYDEPFGTRPAVWVDLNAPFEILRTEAADTNSGIESVFPADWEGRYVLIQEADHVEVHCKKVYHSPEAANSWLFSVYAISENLVLPDSYALGTLNEIPLEATLPWDIPVFSNEKLEQEYTDMIQDVGDIFELLKDRIALRDHMLQVERYGFDLSLYSSPGKGFFATGVYQLDCSNWSEESKQELLGTYNHTSFLSVAPDGTAYLSLGSHEEQKATLEAATWLEALLDGEPQCLFWLEGGHVLPAYYDQMVLTIHGMPEVKLTEKMPDNPD